jgi:hypothetical protein
MCIVQWFMGAVFTGAPRNKWPTHDWLRILKRWRFLKSYLNFSQVFILRTVRELAIQMQICSHFRVIHNLRTKTFREVILFFYKGYPHNTRSKRAASLLLTLLKASLMHYSHPYDVEKAFGWFCFKLRLFTAELIKILRIYSCNFWY